MSGMDGDATLRRIEQRLKDAEDWHDNEYTRGLVTAYKEMRDWIKNGAQL